MSLIRGGGGGGFTLGSAINVFTGVTKASAEQARDNYASSNPSWVAQYNEDTNLNIRLEYQDANNDPVVEYQVRNSSGNEWLTNSSVSAIKGDKGDQADFSALTPNKITKVNQDRDNLEDSPLTVDAQGNVSIQGAFSATELVTNISSLNLGDQKKISGLGEGIELYDVQKGEHYYMLTQKLDREQETRAYQYAQQPYQLVNIQPVFDTTLINPELEFTTALGDQVLYGFEVKVNSTQNNCVAQIFRGDEILNSGSNAKPIWEEEFSNVQSDVLQLASPVVLDGGVDYVFKITGEFLGNSSGKIYYSIGVRLAEKQELLDASDRVNVDSIQTPNIATGEGLKSEQYGDSVVIELSGNKEVIELDVTLDATREINNAYVGKFISITQSGNPVAIPMQLTLGAHDSFETGDTIKVGTSDSYVNYYFAVYYTIATGAVKVKYPSKNITMVRTDSGWDVEKDGTYTNVAIVPREAVVDASQDNPLLTPISSFAFIEHQGVTHFDNADGTRAVSVDLNSIDTSSFTVDGNETVDLIIGGGINYAYDATTRESTISIDPTNISLDGFAELETDVIFSKISIANDADPAYVSVLNVTNVGNSELNLVGTTNIRKVDKVTGIATDVININGDSGDVDFLTVPKKGGVNLTTIEDVGEEITLNNDRIITPNNGTVFQLRDSDKDAGYGNNGSITYYQPQAAGQETLVNNNLNTSKSYFLHDKLNTTSGFLILHEDYVSQIYNQDLTGVTELTMLFGSKAKGRFGKANQTTPAGTLINWNGDYIPNTQDPQDLNPTEWIDKNGNTTNQWTKTGVMSPCYSIGALANNGTALLRRGDVTYQDIGGVKTTQLVTDDNSTLFILPVKTGGGTFGDIKLFPFFMSRYQQSQSEWESYTFDNSADCVGAILRIAYDAALSNANEEAETVVGTEQLSSTGYGYKLFKFAEGMPYHGLISTPSGSRLIHEFPKSKTFKFSPTDAARGYEDSVTITESNQNVATGDLALGQYSDLPLYIMEPNVIINRDQRAWINFPASLTIDISNGFYAFGTVSGWCGNNNTEGNVGVYVGTSENFRSYNNNIGFVLGNSGLFLLDGFNLRTPNNNTAMAFNFEPGVTHMYRYAFYVDGTGLMTYYIFNLNTGQVSTGTQQCNLSALGSDPKLYISYDRYANNTAAIAIGETHLIINSAGDAEDRWNWRF